MEERKPVNKYYLYGTIALILMIFASYIVNVNIVVLFAVIAVCAMIFFADIKTATCVLFLFSAFSYIVVYSRISLIVIVAVVYIFKVILQYRMSVAFIFFSCFVFGYCMLFNDATVAFSLGNIISIVLFLLMGTVCCVVKTEDFTDVFNWYICGFIIASVMGMFVQQIPALAAISNINYLSMGDYTTKQNMYDTVRYAGLSYDPNFFSLSSYVIVATILFRSKERLKLSELLLILFITVLGFFTYSKSYLLAIALVYIVYFFQNDKDFLKRFVGGIILIVLFLVIEKALNLNVTTNLMRRFETGQASGDLTTGRTDLWEEYIEYIFSNVRYLFFGKGYDALSLRKAAHNTFIEYFYHFGIIGIIVWFTYFSVCYSTVKVNSAKNFRKTNKMPMIMLLAGVFFLNTFRFEHTWLLLCVAFYSSKTPVIQKRKEVLLCQN